MEKNQAITLALGAGALGTALAFFGYNYMNQQTVTESEEVPNDDDLYNDVSNGEEKGTEMDEIKKEVQQEVVDKKTAWAAFWGQEYSNDKKKEEEEEDEQ